MTSPRAPLLLLLLAAAGCGDPYAETLAALRARDLDRAVKASEGTAWQDFVRGNAAFARSEAAPQLDLRIALAEDALAAWRKAAMSRDWPEARRNAERGLLRLQQLMEKKRGGPPAPPKPTPPKPPPERREEGTEAEARLEKGQLQDAQVLRLLDLLRQKEAKKMAERRARLGAPQPGVERDW